MARSSTPDAADAQAWERIKDSRNLRELFRGRFTDEESFALMRYFNWDLSRTVSHVLNSEPGEIRDLLNSQDVEVRIGVVTQNDIARNAATRNAIEAETRQFTCADCNKMWWRKVPVRKPVGRCFGCFVRYDAIPRDEEWGLAEFECDCGSTFRGIGAMGRSSCMCYRCGQMCRPVRIIPPLKRNGPRRHTRQQHSCNARNCYNRRGPIDPDMICVHPRSHPAVVIAQSVPHTSTGSTVKTFLYQDDIVGDYEPSLADIDEVRDDE